MRVHNIRPRLIEVALHGAEGPDPAAVLLPGADKNPARRVRYRRPQAAAGRDAHDMDLVSALRQPAGVLQYQALGAAGIESRNNMGQFNGRHRLHIRD